ETSDHRPAKTSQYHSEAKLRLSRRTSRVDRVDTRRLGLGSPTYRRPARARPAPSAPSRSCSRAAAHGMESPAFQARRGPVFRTKGKLSHVSQPDHHPLPRPSPAPPAPHRRAARHGGGGLAVAREPDLSDLRHRGRW